MFGKLFKQSDKLATAPVVCRYCGMVNNVHISAEVIKCQYCSAPLEDAPEAITNLQKAEINSQANNSAKVIADAIEWLSICAVLIAFVVAMSWMVGTAFKH